jgi:hypothetical protein
MTTTAEHGDAPLVVTVGREAPIVGVQHHPEDDLGEAGYTIVFIDAPEDLDAMSDEQADELARTVCLHCLIDEHPEVGRGLDLALEHGSAGRDDAGGWVAPWPEGN